MKTKMFCLLIIGVVVFLISGCEKENVVEQNQTLVFDEILLDESCCESLGEYVPADDLFFKESVLDYYQEFENNSKAVGDYMYNTVNNSISALSIPNYAFRCYDNYKWVYRHVKQPDGSSCSWSSYVICAGNIAAVFNKNYPVTIDQIYTVKEGCGNSKVITSLRNYANSTDKEFVRAKTIALKKSTSNYLDVLKEMMLLLYVNKTPFVTIAMSGKYTHYVTVYSIYWKIGVVGSKIYFTDSLDPNRGSFDKNVKCMDLWDFYCQMRDNSNSYYNFLELLPR